MKGYLAGLDLPGPGPLEYCWSHTDDQYLRQLYAIVRKEQPSLVVELGTYRGYSTNAIGEALLANGAGDGESGHLITVDLHQDFDYQASERLSSCITVVVGNTGDPTLPGEAIAPLIPVSTLGELVDILFIDADHAYESTKADYEAWEPYVRPGGLVLFHDIRTFPEGSSKFWREICAAYPGQTDQVDGSELGVLRKASAG